MKRILIILACAVLAAFLSACSKTGTLITENAQKTPEPTQETTAECTVTPQPAGETEPPSVFWSFRINDFEATSDSLADEFDTIYIRVGCTPTTSYPLSDVIDFAGEGENVTGITIKFEDGTSLNLTPEELSKETTVLVIAANNEPSEKPYLGFDELIYIMPVAEITVHH